jgi:hypothetical protein
MAFVAVYAARATSPSVRRHRQCSQGHASTISTAASAGGRSNEDQWTQHDNIDDAGLLVAKESLNSTHQTRQAHSFIVSDVTALSLIESAIVRHGDSLAQTGPVAFGRRLIIGRGIADPTFGRNRGRTPLPTKYAVFQSFPAGDLGGDRICATRRWMRAVADGGKSVSKRQHHVNWVQRYSEGSVCDNDVKNDSSIIVACEILNANYSDSSTLDIMRGILTNHARDSIASGRLLSFDVLQSPVSPSCFKTVELYASMHDLVVHMETLDPPFAKRVMVCRAAVNRVRQVYAPLVGLFDDSNNSFDSKQGNVDSHFRRLNL